MASNLLAKASDLVASSYERSFLLLVGSARSAPDSFAPDRSGRDNADGVLGVPNDIRTAPFSRTLFRS